MTRHSRCRSDNHFATCLNKDKILIRNIKKVGFFPVLKACVGCAGQLVGVAINGFLFNVHPKAFDVFF